MSMERQRRIHELLAKTRAEAAHICKADAPGHSEKPERVSSEESRIESMRILERLVGPEAVPGWLAVPQPAFQDRTAGHMLQTDPNRVLRHLQWLESGLEDIDTDVDVSICKTPESGGSEQVTTPYIGTMDHYRELAKTNPDIADLVAMIDRQGRQLVRALESLCEQHAKRMAAAKILTSDAA